MPMTIGGRNLGSETMKIRRIAVAAATLAISTGTAMAETEGYVYTDPLPRLDQLRRVVQHDHGSRVADARHCQRA